MREEGMGKRGLAFFSGGKDSIFSLWKAKEQGIPVDLLLFNTHDFPRPNIHEVNFAVVRAIASLIGIPFYTLHLEDGQEYSKLSNFFSDHNVGWVIAGSISSKDQLKWYEGLCDEVGAELYAPLWAGERSSSLGTLAEEVAWGVKAVICDLDPSMLRKELLGRVIDADLVGELSSSVEPCGECGEYHTLVLEAPIMSGRIVLENWIIMKGWNRYMLKVDKFRVEKTSKSRLSGRDLYR
ncbi:MAG: hypothetical protein ACP5KV_02315 [Candidatus Methanomethylicaceae archaeon]